MKLIPTISQEIVDDILSFKRKAQAAWINTDDVIYCPFVSEFKWTYKDSVVAEIAGIRTHIFIK